MLQAQCDPATCQLYLTDQELKRERKEYRTAQWSNMRDIRKVVREKKKYEFVFSGVVQKEGLNKIMMIVAYLINFAKYKE